MLDASTGTKVIVFPMYTGTAYLRSGETVPQEYLQGERAVFELATGVVCSSQAEAREIVISYGVNVSRLAIVPFGINLKKFSRRLRGPSGVLTILTIGAIKPQKNQVDALEVVQYLRDNHGIPTQLLLAGKVADEAYYTHLCQEIRRRNLEDAVKYCGVVEHSDVSAFIDQVHFCMSVSRWETFGIALMEALSLGVPALAYDDVDCFWEYLNRDGACMGVPRDPCAMAEKIANVWSNPSDYLERSRAAPGEVAKFREATVWMRVRSVVDQWVR
jgi:glycosyltransferase involved in cell wall biosynthesis